MSHARYALNRRVQVRVPASSANLGPGFDSIGLALELRDDVTAEVVPQGLHITVEGEGAGMVPLDEQHLVWRSMRTAWDRMYVEPPSGLKLHCHNAIPHSRGLGSSASAIVAGVSLAVGLAGGNDRLDEGTLEVINDISSDLEGHPDNASASVYGGLTISWRSVDRWSTTCPPVHADVYPVVFVPDGTLATEAARAALPQVVPLRDAARTAGRAALLIEALCRRPELLLHGTADWLHQEARRSSYPASMALVDRLRAEGHAAAVSGAGPSVMVLAIAERAAEVVAGRQWRRLTPGIATDGVLLRVL